MIPQRWKNTKINLNDPSQQYGRKAGEGLGHVPKGWHFIKGWPGRQF